MIVNSAKIYRQWVKEKEIRPDVDENFIGCSYNTGDYVIKGFFNMFHGMKPDIEKYLPSLLDIAEDNQAIYEFLQNAVDCNATKFWAFYNDQYFLAINNGSKFDLEGIDSILNIAQSTKSTSTSIGRLGIGFKLAHRLVGKGNGTQELVHGNKGPVMFSWDKREQMELFLSSDESIQHDGLDENPFLFKIAITNFPANVGETVKDINYQDTVIFPQSELEEMRAYVSESLQELFAGDPSSFDQGTLFFIKLGENKRKLLDDDLATLKNGIEYSMNTLKQLTNICFNGESITKKKLEILQASIDKDSDEFKAIDPQYKEYDILYSFGYLPLDFSAKDYCESVSQLKQSPNFYKYFPMGDEVDNMALFVHSDSFQIEANRRKLLNHHTNQELLPRIARFITKTLHAYGHNYSDRDAQDKFLQLYASILLTEKPSAQEKTWMHSIFFDILFAALKEWVPYQNGHSNSTDGIKVKKVKMDFPFDKAGFKTVHWFHWDEQNHPQICKAAVEKLGLEEWNINDVIENASFSLLNPWLDQCSEEEFDSFISEIKATTSTNRVVSLLPKIKLFKVGKERKSREEIMADMDYIISSRKVVAIVPVLQKLGLKCTNEILESHPLTAQLNEMSERQIFERAKTKIQDATNLQSLNPIEKNRLFNVFWGFENNEAEMKRLKLFNNLNGIPCALFDLAPYRENVEPWQRQYIICQEENFHGLQDKLVKHQSFFSDIVEYRYEDIISAGLSIDDLYSIYERKGIVWKDEFSIKLIKAYGCTDEILSLLEKTPSKSAVEEFIKEYGTLELSSTKSYPESSFEYRYIAVAAKVDATSLRNKIKIDDRFLTSFASSDKLSFICKESNITSCYWMKLSDILPEDTQCALYGKVAEMFSSIPGYEKIFSADDSNTGSIEVRLRAELPNQVITPAQYLFILHLNWQRGNGTISFWSDLIKFGETPEQIETTMTQILDYAFENKLTEAMIHYKSIYIWSINVKGRYLFSNDYTQEDERAYKKIEEWCGSDEQKREFLKKLDFKFDDCEEITRRKKFKKDSLEEWEGKVFPRRFLDWVETWSPIEGSNQKKVLFSLTDKFQKDITLNKVFLEEDFNDAKELVTSKYTSWKQSDKISILCIDHEMPCRIVYGETVLVRDNVGEYHYFSDTKHLYIKATKESEIASVLAQVYQDVIPFRYEDYTSICLGSYEEQEALQRKNEEMQRENEALRQENERLRQGKQNRSDEEASAREKERKEYEHIIRSFLEGSFNLDEYNTSSEHIISCYRILCYLKENGYSLADGFDEKAFVKSGKYSTIKLKDGTDVYPSSAKWGVWYIHPNIWRGIVDKGNWACVCTGDNIDDFELIKSEEDLKHVANLANNVLMKLHPTGFYNVMDVINTVFPGEKNGDMDIHLMIKLHETPNVELNSLFDKVFEGDNNNFVI